MLHVIADAVLDLPRFHRQQGWVRSRAWIRLFSLAQGPMAPAGGCMQTPITSVTSAPSSGSVLYSKPRLRSCLRRSYHQLSSTVVALTSTPLATGRLLQ